VIKRGVGLVLLGLIVVGCQGTETANTQPTSVAPIKAASVPSPRTKEPTDIAMSVRRGTPITVWSSPDSAFRKFQDPKQVGFEYNILPPKFEPPYSARTWEEDHAHIGFGEILYDGGLAAAVYQEDRANQDRLDELVRDHQDLVGRLVPTTLQGKKVSYWFWDKDDQRLMICAFATGPNVIKVTVAIGDDVVMDAMGMSPDQAAKDQIKVDSSLLKTPISIKPPAITKG
jgi:hypothetical protein